MPLKAFHYVTICAIALQLTFQAYDQEKKEIDTQLGVEILIIDANDNPPIFEPDLYEVSIEESTPQGNLFVASQSAIFTYYEHILTKTN